MPWLCFKQGINSCGSEYPDQIGQSVRVTIDHRDPYILLEFSTTLGKKDACGASWGIDNVGISIM